MTIISVIERTNEKDDPVPYKMLAWGGAISRQFGKRFTKVIPWQNFTQHKQNTIAKKKKTQN